ncbi:hypothetical protein [Agriterribacter sp.]|uniref:hypothetical protein n=1 Tax=Agriterribacter sp. TaxID=2821509 RepID=UPI002BBFDF93|nr:hypothetical protein [Agriterribacter sp.]HRO45045.1 hypothetical protein [Agriterribacter sp.]HRQ15514.1 hypothetical protein [Agriterribacter sp.]
MKSANLLTVAWLCLSTGGFTQTTHSPLVSYCFSSGAYSKSFQDAFSVISNIGALSTLKNFHAGVYGERRFMLAETSLYTAVATIPSASGNFALQADYSGYKDYSESQVGIAYGLALSEDIGIGAKFNYYHLRIPSYLSASAVNFEIGSVIHISKQVHTGVSVYNPLSSPLGKHTGEKIASVYKAGIGYEMAPSFFTQVEIIKEKNRDVNVHAGFQYKPLEQLFARAGIFTGTSSGYFGVGYLYRQLRMDISVSFHQQLGISPGLLLLYQWTKSTKE